MRKCAALIVITAQAQRRLLEPLHDVARGARSHASIRHATSLIFGLLGHHHHVKRWCEYGGNRRREGGPALCTASTSQ